MNNVNLQKGYTRVIGIFFVFIIISLILDFSKLGHRPETWHKVFHVLLGVIVIYYGWNNKKFWKPFCLVNGAFFIFVSLFGIVWPDFAGLDAFNLADTVMHGIVGISGLIIGVIQDS